MPGYTVLKVEGEKQPLADPSATHFEYLTAIYQAAFRAKTAETADTDQAGVAKHNVKHEVTTKEIRGRLVELVQGRMAEKRGNAAIGGDEMTVKASRAAGVADLNEGMADFDGAEVEIKIEEVSLTRGILVIVILLLILGECTPGTIGV